ncbi:MAG: hypothetical protein V4671_29460 [Armatimonadota bacterium]
MRLFAAALFGIAFICPLGALAQGIDPAPQASPPLVSRMQEGRWAPAVARLATGKLLIAGGYSFAAKDTVASVDLFDPSTERFIPAAPLLHDRNFATATLLLPSRKVLVAGGFSERRGGTLGTAEVYDPETDRWTYTSAPMHDRRELFTATRLTLGRVLMVGGLSLAKRGTLATTEWYDPVTDSFTLTAGALAEDRFGQAAALLADGRVLVVGGQSWKIGQPSRTLASAEIFDPATGRFTKTVGSLHFARDRCTATVLKDGRVLIVGGTDKGKPPLPAEIFDPATGTFRLAASLRKGRMAHDACLLPDGRVVVAGGWADARKATTPSVEVYNPAKDQWLTLPGLPFSAHDLALVWFPAYGTVSATGHILAVGGKSTPGDEAKAFSVSDGVWIDP